MGNVSLENVALRASLLLGRECGACRSLKDFSHSFAGLGTAFEVFHCADLFGNLLSLQKEKIACFSRYFRRKPCSIKEQANPPA